MQMILTIRIVSTEMNNEGPITIFRRARPGRRELGFDCKTVGFVFEKSF